MDVSTKIADLRRDFDLTQKELSDKIGINQSVLNRIEKGTRPIRDDELKTIADYFNVSTDYLLGRDNLNQTPPLSSEQKKLLHGFDLLNADGRTTLCTVLNALLATHSARNMTTLT